MSYTFEDFERDFTREHLHLLTVEDWLNVLPMNELLKRAPVEERLKDVSIEDRFKGIPRKVLEDYLSKKKSK